MEIGHHCDSFHSAHLLGIQAQEGRGGLRGIDHNATVWLPYADSLILGVMDGRPYIRLPQYYPELGIRVQ